MGEDKVRLRRYEDDLYVSGLGVTVMGIWIVLKSVMEMFMVPDDGILMDTGDPTESAVYNVLLIAGMAVVLVIALRLHFYIGLNAIRAAKGKHYKKGYYTAAIVLLVFTVISMSVYREMLEDLDNIDTTIASILVDLTTIYIFATVIISTNKIKKRKTKAEEP